MHCRVGFVHYVSTIMMAVVGTMACLTTNFCNYYLTFLYCHNLRWLPPFLKIDGWHATHVACSNGGSVQAYLCDVVLNATSCTMDKKTLNLFWLQNVHTG